MLDQRQHRAAPAPPRGPLTAAALAAGVRERVAVGTGAAPVPAVPSLHGAILGCETRIFVTRSKRHVSAHAGRGGQASRALQVARRCAVRPHVRLRLYLACSTAPLAMSASISASE